MPAGMPQIELQWRSKWQELDELAGCKNDWSLGTGNPCASDVPVIWAKKGIDMAADEDWLNSFGIENTRSTCLVRAADGVTCTQWMESKGGCWREEASVCSCAAAGCREWHCLTKEVHHQSCWEANWDEAFDTECGPPGYAPWPLGREIGINYTEFQSILAAENSAAALSGTHANAVALLQSRQGSHWYRFGLHCIVQRQVGSKAARMPPAATCSTWRQISSKASSCRCLDSSGPCRRWRCESSAALAAAEVQDFECLEFSGSACVRWSAGLAGPLAQLGECRACSGAGDCLSACRYISMHRIVEFPVGVESGWGERFGHAILHFLWLLPLSTVIGCALAAGDGPDDEETIYWVFKGCVTFVLMVLIMVFAWLVAFYRDVGDMGPVPPLPRWGKRAPTDPLAGLFFTFGTAFLCGCLAGLPAKRNRFRECGPIFVVPVVVAFWGFLWPCGFAIAWLPLALLLCYTCLAVRFDVVESRAVAVLPEMAHVGEDPPEPPLSTEKGLPGRSASASSVGSVAADLPQDQEDAAPADPRCELTLELPQDQANAALAASGELAAGTSKDQEKTALATSTVGLPAETASPLILA